MSIQNLRIISMGRPRDDMTKLIKSGLRDRTQEHLWKVFAYHSLPHATVPHWLDELNAYLEKFQIMNVQKNTKDGKNYDLVQLEDKFVTELFEDGDIDTLNKIWSRKIYPYLPLSEADCTKLRALAAKYAKCIFDKSAFTVSVEELL